MSGSLLTFDSACRQAAKPVDPVTAVGGTLVETPTAPPASRVDPGVGTVATDPNPPTLRLAAERLGNFDLLRWRERLYVWFDGELLEFSGPTGGVDVHSWHVPVYDRVDAVRSRVTGFAADFDAPAGAWLSTATERYPSDWVEHELFRNVGRMGRKGRWVRVPGDRPIAYAVLVPWRGYMLAAEFVVNADRWPERGVTTEYAIGRRVATLERARRVEGTRFISLHGEGRRTVLELPPGLMVYAAHPTVSGGIVALARASSGTDRWLQWAHDTAVGQNGPLPQLADGCGPLTLQPVPQGHLAYTTSPEDQADYESAGPCSGRPYVALLNDAGVQVIETGVTTLRSATMSDTGDLWLADGEGALYRQSPGDVLLRVPLASLDFSEDGAPRPYFMSTHGSWRMRAPRATRVVPQAIDVAWAGGALWVLARANEHTVLLSTRGLPEVRRFVAQDALDYMRFSSTRHQMCNTVNFTLDPQLDDAELAALTGRREEMHDTLAGLVDHVYVATRKGVRILAADRQASSSNEAEPLRILVEAALGQPVAAAWCSPPRLVESVHYFKAPD